MLLSARPRHPRFGAVAGLATVVVAVVTTIAMGAGAAFAASGPSNGSTLTVTSVRSAKNLDVAGGATSDGAAVVQNTATSATSQWWTTRSAGTGVFTVVNANSGRCLAVDGGSTANGAAVVQRTCIAGASEQSWSFTTTSTGTSTITSTRSGLCLDVTAKSTMDGAVIEQYTCNGGTNQQWQLNPAGVTPTNRVGTWAAAVSPGGRSFNGQTVRQIVHTSVGGSSPRVRLSNLFGSGTLTAGHVDVAVQSSGGTVVAGSHHRVTFGGATSVSLAKGSDRTSDAISMTVAADQNLLVSVYVTNSVTSTDWHSSATATTWISGSGDHAADDTTGSYPTTSTSWFLLSGADVLSTTATGTLVTFGDSITDGYRSSANANRRYPDDLARRLVAVSGGPRLGVVNAGIGGNQVLHDAGNTYGYSALNRFSRDALGQPGVKDVLLLEGVNDINSTSPTAAQLTNAYQTLISKARAAGVAVYGGTILPQGSATGSTAENVRTSVNTWIRTSGAFAGVVDFDAALRDPNSPNKMQSGYDSGDHLHPNNAGYQAMADTVTLSNLQY